MDATASIAFAMDATASIANAMDATADPLQMQWMQQQTHAHCTLQLAMAIRLLTAPPAKASPVWDPAAAPGHGPVRFGIRPQRPGMGVTIVVGGGSGGKGICGYMKFYTCIHSAMPYNSP